MSHLQFPANRKTYSCALKGTKAKPEEYITWVNGKYGTAGRQSNENVMYTRMGVTGVAKYAISPLQTFRLFFTPQLMQKLLDNTNRRIMFFLESVEPNFRTKYQGILKPITDLELSAFMGLFYFRGLMKKNLTGVRNWTFSM